jgi:hypothetical protein
MRKIIILAAVAASFAATGIAQASGDGRPCTDRPVSEYLSLDALKAKVAEQGYEVRRGKVEKGCAEMYVVDKAGRKAELFLDPTNGAIVGHDVDSDKD